MPNIVKTNVPALLGSMPMLADEVDLGNGQIAFQLKLGSGITGNTLDLANAYTNATAGLTNTNLSFGVQAGQEYQVEGFLQVSNTVAAEGIKFDFGGGSATASLIFLEAHTDDSVVTGTLVSTSLTGAINYTTVTGTVYIHITGFIRVNLSGTIIFRAAENTHATGTLTIGAGSWLRLTPSTPV